MFDNHGKLEGVEFLVLHNERAGGVGAVPEGIPSPSLLGPVVIGHVGRVVLAKMLPLGWPSRVPAVDRAAAWRGRAASYRSPN